MRDRGRRGYFPRAGARSGDPYLPPEFDQTIRTKDGRFAANALVYGVVVGGAARAYPFEHLRRDPVVEESIAGVPVSVWFDRWSRSANAFDRRLGDRTLTFSHAGRGRFEDRESGSRFDMDGQCVAGPLRGERLEPVFGLMAEWYGWFANHPLTTVWSP
jgi:hypothetical protein